MKTLLASLVLVALLGCSSNDSSTPPLVMKDAGTAPDTFTPDAYVSDAYVPDAWIDPLIGIWYVNASSTEALGAKFDGKNFSMNYITVLTDGTIVVEVIQGTYTVSGNSIVMRLTGSSCQGVQNPTSNAMAITYSRSGTGLMLTIKTTILAMQPASSPTGTAVFKLGCVKSDGTFVANPVTTVP